MPHWRRQPLIAEEGARLLRADPKESLERFGIGFDVNDDAATKIIGWGTVGLHDYAAPRTERRQFAEPHEPMIETGSRPGGHFQNLDSGPDRLDVPQRRGRSNSTASARSIFVMIATSAVLKIVGYLSGLSSPSVTENSTSRSSSPRS